MKKLLAILTIIMALGIGGSVMASTASAANCSLIRTGNTYWTSFDNKLNVDARIDNCSWDVDKVQYYNAGSTGVTSTWYDWTWLTGIPSTGVKGNYIQSVYSGVSGAVLTYTVTPWCSGGRHSVNNYWQYRIHNSTGGGSWGPWHGASNTKYDIIC